MTVIEIIEEALQNFKAFVLVLGPVWEIKTGTWTDGPFFRIFIKEKELLDTVMATEVISKVVLITKNTLNINILVKEII